ncbi:hypothetical protein AB3662_19760 [Sorangium cellulosum]|uniref:hypothetical protein n=1 Tax=Sorangium cellulosum TaxID=56 RepID=UPI003D9A8DAF
MRARGVAPPRAGRAGRRLALVAAAAALSACGGDAQRGRAVETTEAAPHACRGATGWPREMALDVAEGGVVLLPLSGARIASFTAESPALEEQRSERGDWVRLLPNAATASLVVIDDGGGRHAISIRRAPDAPAFAIITRSGSTFHATRLPGGRYHTGGLPHVDFPTLEAAGEALQDHEEKAVFPPKC